MGFWEIIALIVEILSLLAAIANNIINYKNSKTNKKVTAEPPSKRLL